ncbi:hypothetical protein Adi01nite_23370 [Amorphoplanes digitatis]|nr:hypothetical protein Adi01nite_23370 [Actinoplanes digitatis]
MCQTPPARAFSLPYTFRMREGPDPDAEAGELTPTLAIAAAAAPRPSAERRDTFDDIVLPQRTNQRTNQRTKQRTKWTDDRPRRNVQHGRS